MNESLVTQLKAEKKALLDQVRDSTKEAGDMSKEIRFLLQQVMDLKKELNEQKNLLLTSYKDKEEQTMCACNSAGRSKYNGTYGDGQTSEETKWNNATMHM